MRATLLQAGVFAAAWVALAHVDSASRVPAMWPAAGLIAGLHLTVPKVWRSWLVAGSLLALLVAHLLQDYPLTLAVGFSASSVLAAYGTRRMLTHSLAKTRVELMDEGDVSRMIVAIALGSGLGAGGYALTCALTGTGDPALGALAAFGAHASAMMVLLPLFLQTPRFAAAGQRAGAVPPVADPGRHDLPGVPLRRRAAGRLRGDADVRLAGLPRHPA